MPGTKRKTVKCSQWGLKRQSPPAKTVHGKKWLTVRKAYSKLHKVPMEKAITELRPLWMKMTRCVAKKPATIKDMITPSRLPSKQKALLKSIFGSSKPKKTTKRRTTKPAIKAGVKKTRHYKHSPEFYLTHMPKKVTWKCPKGEKKVKRNKMDMDMWPAYINDYKMRHPKASTKTAAKKVGWDYGRQYGCAGKAVAVKKAVAAKKVVVAAVKKVVVAAKKVAKIAPGYLMGMGRAMMFATQKAAAKKVAPKKKAAPKKK